MRTFDLTPFYRSTVGFDRLFSLLDQATADGSPGYPPYNIERTGDNSYRISVAVSGFSLAELSIVAKENTLTIKGEKVANENDKEKAEVLYCGIAARAFERAFQLADFVVVKNASRERIAACRSRARDPGGQEAPYISISGSVDSPTVIEGSTQKAAASVSLFFGWYRLKRKCPGFAGAFYSLFIPGALKERAGAQLRT